MVRARAFVFLFAFLTLSEWVAAADKDIWPADYQNLHAYLFANNDMGLRKGKRTDGFLLLKDGEVLLEKYARGYTPEKKHIMWSVSKTVMALLYGVAMQEGKVHLQDSICQFAKFPTAEHCKIKINHVLTWTTGIQWVEEYERSHAPTKASVLAMLYGEGRSNMVEFVKKQPLVAEPGTRWLYSSGDSILAAHILAGVYKDENKALHAVFREKLFQPLQMKNTIWEEDASSNLGAAYYLYSTPRDMAQVGKLIMADGYWQGHQLISQEYLQLMRRVPESFKVKSSRPAHDHKNISGAHIWLNDPQGADHKTPWGSAPEDAMVAMGHWGQYLIIIPSKKLIAVRVGDTRDRSVELKELVAETLKAMGGTENK